MADRNISVTYQQSPGTFTTSELGVHTVQVLYTSQHFANKQAMPVMVTVDGERDSITTMYAHYTYMQELEQHMSVNHH